MKKAILIIFVALLFMSASQLSALDSMVGAKSSYYAWRPYYKDFTQGGIDEMGTGSGILYGPVLWGCKKTTSHFCHISLK